MIFLLDTTAFSDLMREHPQTDAHLVGVSEADRVVICSVVRRSPGARPPPWRHDPLQPRRVA